MGSKQVVPTACLAVLTLTLYFASYLVCSRCFAWRGNRLWSFFPPPAGLVTFELKARYRAFGSTPWEGWQHVESIPGIFFRPCIRIDDTLTGRTYLPTYTGIVCFN
jgi:hypothetical protein